jgi:hypothetical protein
MLEAGNWHLLPDAELPQGLSPLMGDVNVAAEPMAHYEVFEVGERVHCPY